MNFGDRKTLQAFLNKHGLSPQKGLGQHFLCSDRATEAIFSRLDGMKSALEIGPGPGILTAGLSQRFKTVALEVDRKLARALKESAPEAEIIFQDALKSDLSAILAPLPGPRAIVSNLPYYITGPLLAKIEEAHDSFDVAVLMMQKEVGERIAAKPGDSARGAVSVMLQARFAISKVADVRGAEFVPPPKVDSVILEFRPIPAASDIEGLRRVVTTGFSQPRKTLANNLTKLGASRETIAEAIAIIGNEKIRPHMLTLEQWQTLATAIQK